jgi:hypothetical protein
MPIASTSADTAPVPPPSDSWDSAWVKLEAVAAAPAPKPPPRRKPKPQPPGSAIDGDGARPATEPVFPAAERSAPSTPSDPGPPPIQAIGKRAGKFFLFDSSGEFLELGYQALGQAPAIRALFGGTAGADWLRNKFPHFDREGAWTRGFNIGDANDWLVNECCQRGVFDPDKLPARGVGVWLADGAIAVHVGNSVRFISRDGTAEDCRAGFMDRGALWPAAAAIPPPAPAADAETAQQVERAFGKWHWWNLGEERVFTGLWAAGLLGAAISWRAHGLVVGPAGTGKSTLLALYCALSPLALPVNDYTAPGVRQLLTGRAAPLVLDEADEDPETMGRLQAVISLLRRASGGEGARVVRGTGEGNARTYHFTSPAILGAVLAPPLMPQDATRITRLELVRIPDGAAALPIDEMMGWARRHAAALWGRAIDGIPRFRRNLGVLRAVLMGRGCTPRLADQVGTILAARAMMLEDEPLEATSAEEDVNAVAWLLQTREQAVEDGGGMRCLQHLLTSPADVLEAGARPTFERLIARAIRGADDDARRKLMDHGLRLARFPIKAQDVPDSLLVARSHPALTKVFAGTLWAGNRWADDLKHLPGACMPPDPIRFRMGLKLRVVALPMDLLGADPAPDDDGEQAPPPCSTNAEDGPF